MIIRRSCRSASPSDGVWRRGGTLEGGKGGRGPDTGGFTVLEVLIALGMLGLIMSAVYGSYRAVTGSIASLEPGMALDQKGRFFLQRLSRQFRCCYGGRVDQGKRSLPNPRAAGPGTSEEQIRFFQGGSTLSGGTVVQFITTSSTLSRTSDAGYLAVVSYKVDVWQHALLTSEEVYGRPGKEDDKSWRVVLTDLREVALSYFDGRDWRTEWNSHDAGGLPKAVRIRLVLDSERDGASRSFTAVAPVRCGTLGRLGAEVREPANPESNRDQ